MNIQGRLRILQSTAGNCKWIYQKGMFIAMHGNLGMRIQLRSDAPAHEIRTRALAVQKELISVKKGQADEETTKEWGREADKYMASKLIAGDVEQNRKRQQIRPDSA